MKVALLLVSVLAIAIAQQSICDSNSVRLGVNNAAVVETLVNGTLTKVVGDADLIKFFNGEVPPGSNNILNNNIALGILRDHLIEFFAQPAALNCTDGSIGAYQGNANMEVVHIKMPITTVLFNRFNGFIAQTAEAAGVPADQITAVGNLLNSFQPQICNQIDCLGGKSICDFNSARLGVNNAIVVETIVNGTIAAAVADAELVKYFNGEIPAGSTNFLVNPIALGVLRDHLIEFFAQKAALGCTDGTIGIYTGKTDLKDVHKNMPINTALFNKFNGAIAATAKAAGVPQYQIDLVGAVLESFKGDICNQPDCAPDASAFTAGASLFAMFVGLMFSKLF